MAEGCYSDDGSPWYHGFQQRLTRLRAGSSITQNRDVAKAFSHRPSHVTMSQSEEGMGWSVRHNGATPAISTPCTRRLAPAMFVRTPTR